MGPDDFREGSLPTAIKRFRRDKPAGLTEVQAMAFLTEIRPRKAMNRRILASSILTAVLGLAAHGQSYTLTPLTSFGGGDGWLAPGEGGITHLGTANNERGFSYNAATGNLLLVSRNGGVGVYGLNAATGALLDSELVDGQLSDLSPKRRVGLMSCD